MAFKLKNTLLLTFIALTAVSCRSQNESLTKALASTAGVVAGGALGHAIGDGGAGETAIGAIAGGALGYGASQSYINRKGDREELEGQLSSRKGMHDEYQDFWDAQVQRPVGSMSGTEHSGHLEKYLQPVTYPAGYYEGVRYHTRQVSPTDTDPMNPKR